MTVTAQATARALRALTLLLAALAGAAGFGSAVLAQTPGTAGPLTFDLFSRDSVDIEPRVARSGSPRGAPAHGPGQCPVGRLTFHVEAGDKLFQDALGAARRDAVLAFLASQGIAASRFFADVAVGGTQNHVRLDINAARDDMAPTLDVEWTPPKGSKVTVGTRIAAKAVARDDANLWQTGIKTIDLNVDRGGPFGFEDFPQPPRTCERLPPPRTLDGVYTVPSDPPPLVRLRAIAKDYAGNETETVGRVPDRRLVWEVRVDQRLRRPARFWRQSSRCRRSHARPRWRRQPNRNAGRNHT